MRPNGAFLTIYNLHGQRSFIPAEFCFIVENFTGFKLKRKVKELVKVPLENYL